jgi:hypothetical protein
VVVAGVRHLKGWVEQAVEETGQMEQHLPQRKTVLLTQVVAVVEIEALEQMVTAAQES